MLTFFKPRLTAAIHIALLLSAGAFALQAQANEALANKSGCLGCHAIATKLVGPAYKDVAAKYADQADAQAMLMQSIRNGSVGKWGELPMPAHPKISDADLKKLATWILGIK
jgi:cytochrome c